MKWFAGIVCALKDDSETNSADTHARQNPVKDPLSFIG